MNATRPTATTGDTATGRRPAGSTPALVKLIVVLLAGAIPALLDTAIVNVAVDAIGRDLHATVSQIQWVITGYLLSFAMVIPLSGWALSRFGGRAVWMFSLALFLAGLGRLRRGVEHRQPDRVPGGPGRRRRPAWCPCSPRCWCRRPADARWDG